MAFKSIVIAVLGLAAIGAAFYAVKGPAAGGGLTEQDLRNHLGKLASLSADKIASVKVDQVVAFHTTVQPYETAQFTGYDIVLSGFDETTCNQIMKSPWVEDMASAKSLSTRCGDPKAEIHLLMQTR